MMRRVSIAVIAALVAAPAIAQPARPGEQIEAYAPAVDRTADALLNLDVGPILDALDPYRPHPHHTLREMARRDDPEFEHRLHRSIYTSAALAGRTANAVAAAEPALRRALHQFERDMDAALAGAPPRNRGRPSAVEETDGAPWGD